MRIWAWAATTHNLSPPHLLIPVPQKFVTIVLLRTCIGGSCNAVYVRSAGVLLCRADWMIVLLNGPLLCAQGAVLFRGAGATGCERGLGGRGMEA